MVKNNRKTIDDYTWEVKVQTEAHLDYKIKDYFEGLNIYHESDGTSIISGDLTDLPAVYGFILQLRDAGIVLVSMRIERYNCSQ